MTKEKIHELIDLIAAKAPWPIRGFEVRDWESLGELQIGVTFKTGEGTSFTAATQQPAQEAK